MGRAELLKTATGIGLLAAFGLLTPLALRDHWWVPSFDREVSRLLGAVPAPPRVLSWIVAQAGSPGFTLLLTGSVAGWLVARRRIPSALLVVSAMAATVLVEAVIRLRVDDLPRSLSELGALLVGRGEWAETYPSGHAARAALWGALFPAVALRRARTSCLFGGAILAILVGLQRIEAGAHTADEVLAGWLLGWGIAVLGLACLPLVGMRERVADRGRLPQPDGVGEPGT